MITVDQYAAADGCDVFAKWLDSLADRRGRAAVAIRIGRLRRGLLGDWRACRAGVMELRIDVGPGYRVYFARESPGRILLICGGTKRSQASDIERAVELLLDYRRRTR
jgi:putative addiction module killer protein